MNKESDSLPEEIIKTAKEFKEAISSEQKKKKNNISTTKSTKITKKSSYEDSLVKQREKMQLTEDSAKIIEKILKRFKIKKIKQFKIEKNLFEFYSFYILYRG